MRLRKHFLQSETGRARLVNVMGLCRGAGATHLAIMLGIYLAHGMHCKTAVIEYGQHGCFEKIQEEKKTKRVRLSVKAAQRHGFSYKGIDLYEGIFNAGFVQTLAENYDYIIVDMRAEDIIKPGSQLIGMWLEGLVSIGVMSDVPWKLHECMEQLEKVNAVAEGKKIRLASLTKTAKHADKNMDIIPYEPDPFNIKAQSLPWLKKIIQPQYYIK